MSSLQLDQHHHGAIETTKWTLHALLVINTITGTVYQQRGWYRSRSELMAGELLSRVPND
jgi:hypothetical protein